MNDAQTTTDTQEVTSADVATMPNETGELVPLTKELVGAWLEGADLTETDDGEELDLDEALRILSAEGPEEVLAVNEMRKIDDYDGKAFVVLSVMWRKSTRSESGKGRYAVMRCVDANGEEFLTTCGATKVVLQLRWAQLHGALPWQVELAATKTEAGNTVKELVAPEKPF